MSLVLSSGLESLFITLSITAPPIKRRKPNMLVSISGISREMSAINALIGMPGKAAWVLGGATRTLGEATRTLGEATRTLGEATLTGESGGDPGADNSESEVEGDLLESLRLSATSG